jgi:3-oxoadipate enol-lactonase
VEYCGEKEPAVVAVHGGPGLGLEPFKPTLTELCADNRVVLYDQRGCGASSRHEPEELCPLEYHFSDLAAVIRQYASGKAILLGHSFGCYISLLFTFSHPELVSHLILVSPVPPRPERGRELHKWHKLLTPEMRKELHEINYAKGDMDELANRRLQIMLPHYFSNKAALQEFRHRNIQVSGSVIDNCARFQKFEDIRNRLEGLSQPVDIICGAEDLRTPPDYSREYLQYVPECSYHELEDCGHFPFMERPQEFLKTVTRILQP